MDYTLGNVIGVDIKSPEGSRPIANSSHTVIISISKCRSKTRWYHRLGRLMKAPFLYLYNGDIKI